MLWGHLEGSTGLFLGKDKLTEEVTHQLCFEVVQEWRAEEKNSQGRKHPMESPSGMKEGQVLGTVGVWGSGAMGWEGSKDRGIEAGKDRLCPHCTQAWTLSVLPRFINLK